VNLNTCPSVVGKGYLRKDLRESETGPRPKGGQPRTGAARSKDEGTDVKQRSGRIPNKTEGKRIMQRTRKR